MRARATLTRGVSRCVQAVRNEIGGLAIPEYVVCVPGLPKTRSGKIMRRVLRKIAAREADQARDVSVPARRAAMRTTAILCDRCARRPPAPCTSQLGDISTLADPSIVPELIKLVEAAYAAKKK